MINYPIEVNLFIFAVGLCIGSFMNVCIYRLPLSKSIAYPPSACPECGYQIKFYDNIPLISYAVLLGRCRKCRTRISMRYPLVELLSGFFALAVFFKFGLTWQFFVYYLFTSVLLVVTFIDIDHQIIPNIISLPGIPLFFIGSFAVPAISYKESLFGILIGGGSLYIVGKIYSLITKQEGMGGGDVKLLAMMGALLGAKGVFFIIFISSALGTFAGFMIMAYTRSKNMKLPIPYGPFLSMAAILYIFFGPDMIYWYLTLYQQGR